MGWRSFTLRRILTSSLFLLFRKIFTTVQSIYWELNGTAKHLRKCSDPKYYSRSAQVLDVVYFNKFCELQSNCIEDFLLVHNRFEDPQFIIDNEHITLYTINDTSAIFCVTKDKNARLWKTEYSSFMRLAQQIYAHQIIIVPLSVFHRMAETIGDPKGDIIFIFNVARCGSTLLTQIFEYTERCVALSEPDAPNIVAARYNREGDTPELRQLARDVIRWDCRPYPSMKLQPLAYVLKLTAISVYALSLFGQIFPNSRKMFMYRDIVKVSKSLYRMSATLPSLTLAYVLGRISGRLTEMAVESMGFSGKDFRVRLTNGLTFGVILNAVTIKAYLDMRRRGEKVDALRYEDLVADPLATCRLIMEYCGLPVELATAGVRGMEVDSQRNSIISKAIIGNLAEPEVTPEVRQQTNELLKKHGLPLIGEECLIEGTFSKTNKLK